MTNLAHESISHNLKLRILEGEFTNSKLPNEQKLAQNYKVSRSTIKNILNILAQQGIIFKKRGAGSFVNPLYIRNQSLFQSKENNLDITDHLDDSEQKTSPKLIALIQFLQHLSYNKLYFYRKVSVCMKSSVLVY